LISVKGNRILDEKMRLQENYERVSQYYALTIDWIRIERKILEGILEKDNVDGVIVEATKSALPNPNLEYYRELQRRQTALLFFNCRYPELDAPIVALDDLIAEINMS